MNDSAVTDLLQRACAGDASAAEAFYRSVQTELRRIAAANLKSANPPSLQITMLVDDAFVNLVQSPGTLLADSRTQFFRLAARAMRNLVVDHLRSRNTKKRGGGVKRSAVDPDELFHAADVDEVVAVREELDRLARALDKLERMDPRAARVVQMFCLGGVPLREVAALLSVSLSTVKTDWAAARAFLYRELTDEP